MATITLSVSDEVRKRMKLFDEVNWSAFIRKQIERKTLEVEQFARLKSQLDVEEQDAQVFSVKLQRAGRSGRLAALKKKGLI